MSSKIKHIATDGRIEKLGWKYYLELNGFRKESDFSQNMFSPDQQESYDFISYNNANQIAKEVQRREIEAKICGLNYVLIEHRDKLDQLVISDINKTIDSLKSQLEELDK